MTKKKFFYHSTLQVHLTKKSLRSLKLWVKKTESLLHKTVTKSHLKMMRLMLNIKFKWRNSEVKKVMTLNLIKTTKNLTKNTEVRKAMIQNLTKIMKNQMKNTEVRKVMIQNLTRIMKNLTKETK